MIQKASIQSSLYSQGFPSTGSGSVWERSLTLFEMTHGLCSCHSEQSEESFSILRVMVDLKCTTTSRLAPFPGRSADDPEGRPLAPIIGVKIQKIQHRREVRRRRSGKKYAEWEKLMQ